MKLVLHSYWRSSASHRVRIGLGLKGLAYEDAEKLLQQHGWNIRKLL
jgi:glutathione S-transferase